MRPDEHLGTGPYDPERYWSARARVRDVDPLKAVCAFTATRLENRSMHRVQESALGRALDALPPGRRDVLDFGCGIGRWARLAAGRGRRWTGVDVSEAMLEIAAARHPGAAVAKVRDGWEIPFPDLAFDLALSVTVLHHNPYECQERIVGELARVLRPGGALILLENLGGPSSFNMFGRPPESWTALAAARGLHLVRWRGVRYWIVRDAIAERIAKVPRLARAWRRLASAADLGLDPVLNLPGMARGAHAAVMTFVKPAGGRTPERS